MKEMEPLLLEKLSHIRLLILDVDGVMTDGRIVMNDLGQETKMFDVKDGHGLKLLMRYDVDVAILTGRQSAVVDIRAADLGIQEVHQRIWDKLSVYEEIIERRGLNDEEVAFIGDDVVDVPVLRRVGFSAAVANAADEVREVVHYITSRDGGRGAVREVCDLILRGKGIWVEIVKKYQLNPDA